MVNNNYKRYFTIGFTNFYDKLRKLHIQGYCLAKKQNTVKIIKIHTKVDLVVMTNLLIHDNCIFILLEYNKIIFLTFRENISS